jgi:putative transposase
MGRIARVVVPGIGHHVTQRGNHRQDVFFDDEDRRVYLAALGENAGRYGVRLFGYCLMTNHVHLIAVPEREDSLARALGCAHGDYARWLHVRKRQTGQPCGEYGGTRATATTIARITRRSSPHPALTETENQD